MNGSARRTSEGEALAAFDGRVAAAVIEHNLDEPLPPAEPWFSPATRRRILRWSREQTLAHLERHAEPRLPTHRQAAIAAHLANPASTARQVGELVRVGATSRALERSLTMAADQVRAIRRVGGPRPSPALRRLAAQLRHLADQADAEADRHDSYEAAARAREAAT